MKLYYFLLFLVSSNFLAAQQNLESSFIFQDSLRTFKVYVPQLYLDNPSTEVPLLLNLHGYGSENWQQEFYGNFLPLADIDNFIICHPNGTLDTAGSRFWNAGFAGSTIDDIGFLSALIDTISAKYSINAAKVFSTGMSNGGYMSYTLACELPNKIKKVASVTGSMTKVQYANCTNQNPIPVLQIHGTNDATVNYNGNTSTEAIEKVVGFWVNQNNCDSTAVETALPNTNPSDNSTVKRYDFKSSCDENTSVVFYKVENGGHTWPGAEYLIPGLVTNQDFSASEVIWKFFYPETKALGINKLINETAISIFPNPTHTIVNIELENNNKLLNVQVYNTDGKLVLIEKTTKIDLSNLNQGIYFLRISTKEGMSNQRVIKQ